MVDFEQVNADLEHEYTGLVLVATWVGLILVVTANVLFSWRYDNLTDVMIIRWSISKILVKWWYTICIFRIT